MRLLFLTTTLACVVALGATSQVDARQAKAKAKISATVQQVASGMSLEAAAAGVWRSDGDKARDTVRHPAATLGFWGIRPNMTVVEIRPGGGYWTDILAPYLAAGKGKLIVTSGDPDRMTPTQIAGRDRFLQRYKDNAALYGSVETGVFAGNSDKPLAPAGSVDLIISSRNFHGFVLQNIKDYAIKSMFDALKPEIGRAHV